MHFFSTARRAGEQAVGIAGLLQKDRQKDQTGASEKMNIVEKIASRSSKLNVCTQQKEWNE